VDGSDLYYTKNAGGAATFATETGNLPAGFTRPTSLEFISNNGVNAVLIGGLNTPLTCTSAPNGCVIASTQSPITVADSDASGNLSGWRAFGQGLPNALVSTMSYDSTADVLAVGSVGRGVWVLYDVTSNFAQATVLQFGLANNDSNPDASLLTDGTVGSRPLIKYGTGTLTITGNATYTGSTTVNAGTLEVDGSIANTSSVTINSGGVLSGVGIVDPPTTTIMGGASLAPGNAANPTGIFTITGNLAFQPGAFYLVQVTQSAASSTVVSGTASLNGAVFATFSPNVVLQRQYTILQSAGLSGTTFSGLASQPTGFDASLAYTADNVLLNLTATLGSGAGLNTDQQNVANAINAAFNNGGALPANFGTVFGLTGSALTQALSQLDGEDATDASKGAFQFMSDFLNLMLDPSTGGSAIGAGGNALGFQPEQDATLPPEIVSAYNAMLAKAPPKPQSFDQRWTAWGSAFGGASHLDGDPVAGTNTVNASDFGFAGGMDYRLSPSAILGFALAGGGTNWNLDQNLGSGRSDAFQAGVYVKAHSGPAYLSAALAFANHWFTTQRTSALGDQLQGKFMGQSVGGRLEAGYRFGLPSTAYVAGLTPYAAVQAQNFHTSAFSEADLTAGGFGLNFAAMNATDTRSELGMRADDLAMLDAMPLILRGRLAWAHDWVSNPALGAAFQTLPGASFIVNGAAPPKNSALTTASAELRMTENWSMLAKFDGEFGKGAQTYGGTGTLRYAW